MLGEMLKPTDTLFRVEDDSLVAAEIGGMIVTDLDTVITVPAGRFRCIRVDHVVTKLKEGKAVSTGPDGSYEFWCPGVGQICFVDCSPTCLRQELFAFTLK